MRSQKGEMSLEFLRANQYIAQVAKEEKSNQKDHEHGLFRLTTPQAGSCRIAK